MNTRKALVRVAAICLRVIVLVAVILGLVYLGQTTYRLTHAIFREEALEEAPGRDVRIKLYEDVSVKKFAEVLEQNELIEDGLVFVIQMKMAEFDGPIKAGSYELNTSMKPSEMLKVLAETNGDQS